MHFTFKLSRGALYAGGMILLYLVSYYNKLKYEKFMRYIQLYVVGFTYSACVGVGDFQ